MSSIDKLFIQGIRCYGPEEGVVIPFKSPLTIIFGANGTGKTTVIECLRYITTGDPPPNSKGGAFVHDPGIAKKDEIAGQVILEFHTSKQKILCSHSVQSTRKIDEKNVPKCETRTTNILMEITDADGKKSDITGRTETETCRLMSEHLGVSKGLLANVIFCHQEDSNWPFSEGKVLQTRFDEIFASTRYTKALESIKKIQQGQDQDCKELKIDMPRLQKQKEKADELQSDLSETQQKVKESQDSVLYIDSQLKPTEKSSQKLHDMHTKFVEKDKLLVGLKSKIQQLEHNQCQLEKMIDLEIATKGIEELIKCCNDHESQLELDEKELDKNKTLISETEIEKKELDKKRDELIKEQERLRQKEEDNQQRIKQCDNLVRTFSKKHDIKVETSGQLSQSDVQQFQSSIIQKQKSMEQSYHSKMEEFNKMINDVQEKLNNIKLEQAKYSITKDAKTEQKEENERKRKEIDNELGDIVDLDTKVATIKNDLQKAEKDLREVQKNYTDVNSLESECDSLQKQKETVDVQISQLQEELDKLSRQATQRGALEALRKKKKEIEIKVSIIMAEVQPVERDLKMIPTSEDLGAMLAAKKELQEKEVKDAEIKMQNSQESNARLVYMKESLNKELEKQKKNEQDLQQKIDRACDGKDYQSLVKEVQKDIKSTQEDIAILQGGAPYFKKCVEEVRTSKKCPVCVRGFDSQLDLEKVISMLITKINESESHKIPNLQKTLQEQQQKQKCLQQLKPSIEELEKLNSHDIPRKREEILSTNQELQSIEIDLKKLKIECSTFKEGLENIKAVELKVSHHNEDLEKLGQQIAKEEDELGDIGTTERSYNVVKREYQDALQKQNEVNHKSKELFRTMQQLREYERTVQDLREEKLKITESMRKREELMKQKTELISTNETLEKDLVDNDNKVSELTDELAKVTSEKDCILKQKEKTENVSKVKIDNILEDERKLKAVIQEINSYYASGDEKALEKCEKEFSICQRKTDELTQKLSNMQKNISHLQEQLANAKARMRKFKDTIQFLNQQKEIDNDVKKVQQLETELKELEIDDYDREYKRLKKKENDLREQRGRLDGVKSGLEDKIKKIQEELRNDLYEHADTKYLHKAAEIKALQVTTSDLDKFYKALDSSITQYHNIKMKEVNKIIQELWVRIYRGGDIDNIEIESSSDDTEESSISKRRVYNYKVVMDKGGTKLDMRGRCSAGQKVLASLVIRLALAEVFCLNCGILTLDEPTTNLDGENVEALAQALADIILLRREQSNLQLVVITHDQDFVDMMGRFNYVNEYLLLKREGESTVLQSASFNPVTANVEV